MTAVFGYDAYLSYAEADAVWVDDVLLPVLTGAGLRVAADEDARLGAPQLPERERLLLASRHLVPVLSPAWLQDRQAVFTQQIAEYIDPAADATRILPVLLQPTPHLPPRLARLEATDCSNPAHWEKAVTGPCSGAVQDLRSGRGSLRGDLPARSTGGGDVTDD